MSSTDLSGSSRLYISVVVAAGVCVVLESLYSISGAPVCYEIMTPESVGVPTNNLVLGKHSGRHALALRYEDLGYSMQPDELEAIYQRFTTLADRKKRIYDQDLIALLQTAPTAGERIATEGAAATSWARVSSAA